MLKKLTGAGKSSAVGVQRRATITQADERLAEITNTTPTSQTPTQELKRYGHFVHKRWCCVLFLENHVSACLVA